MKPERKADLFAGGMIAGGLPCTLFILLFIEMMAAREAGRPYSGDALGLMMMSFWAYALAFLSCAAGILYFGAALFKHKRHLRIWHWLALTYSIIQVVIPVAYNFSWSAPGP